MSSRALRLVLVLAALPFPAFAHQLDEYLQSTLVSIEPGSVRLSLNLTPGADVAQAVLDVIDLDRDGVISLGEAAAYGELLKRDLIIRLDDHPIDLKLIDSQVPAPTTLRGGAGIIQLQFAAVPPSLADGTHRVALENRHGPTSSAYLLNAAQPASASVQIVRQIRNTNQSKGEIEFNLGPPTNTSPTNPPPGSSSRGVRIVSLAALVLAAVAGVWWMRKTSPRATI